MRYVIKLVLRVKPEQSEGKIFFFNFEKKVENVMVLLGQYTYFILNNIFFIHQQYSVFSTLTKFANFCLLVLILPTLPTTKNLWGEGLPPKSASESSKMPLVLDFQNFHKTSLAVPKKKFISQNIYSIPLSRPEY